MTESEWKTFRRIRETALDRLCERILREVGDVIADAGKTNHQRYGEIFTLLRERDDDVAAAFDGARRSTALMQLLRMCSLRLLTEDELAQFSEQTRETIALLAQ